METNIIENNQIELIGEVTSDKKLSHEVYGEKFYLFNLEVSRLSGASDIIPIMISERLLVDFDLSIGVKVRIEGQFRSYNNYENERNRLVLTVFAKDIFEAVEPEGDDVERPVSNQVTLVGFICKKPIYRETPFGREIADILVAVNRAYNKSDYIPSIAWGRNARFAQNLEIGEKIKLTGRVQSRSYDKKFEDGTVQTRTAYEVSVSGLEVINDNEISESVTE